MAQPLLSIRNLQTWFQLGEQTARVVDGVSLDIQRGETFALVGESGCGKSMTSLSIMRLVPAPGRIVGGQILLDGQDLLGLPEAAMRKLRGKRIAMIFQDPMSALNPVFTVGRQIAEVLWQHQRLKGPVARRRAVELLAAVGIPAPDRRIDDYPHQLSGGMKQRVMIAIALAGEPDLLIADEPTTALDVTIQAQVLQLLRELQQQTGMAMLLITHDLGVVAETADRVAVMYAGHIVEQAERDTFFRQPQHPYSLKLFQALPELHKRRRRLAVIKGTVPSLAQEFVGCRFADRCDYAWSLCREQAPAWLAAGPGQQVRCHRADPELLRQWPPQAVPGASAAESETDADRAGGALLRVTGLKVHFPLRQGLFRRQAEYVRAVDDIDLEIEQGRTLALVGESGCGKTTAGKAILQLIRPTAGEVMFKGEDLVYLSGERLRRRRRDMQLIFQDPFASMNPRMRVGAIIEEALLAQRVGGDQGQRRVRVDTLLEHVGLSATLRQRYPHEFSGGQRQRICIARALALEPKLIVCDEPTSALDVSVQAQILNLMRQLQGQFGIAYLFITHNISVVSYLADEVAVMYLGRIVERGTVEEVLQSPRHPYTQALLAAVPRIETAGQRAELHVAGDIPSPIAPPSGCHFHPRCPHAMAECKQAYPPAVDLSTTHSAHCFLLC